MSALRLAPLLLACVLSGAQAAPLIVHVRSTTGQPLDESVVAVEVSGQHGVAPTGTKAQMGQRNREFVPHVLPIEVGTLVDFPNFDTVRHHVYSFSAPHRFDLKLYSGRQAEPQLFDKPGIVALGCNIHDNMSAFIIVLETDQFTMTDATGTAHLQVPPGNHQLRIWNERLSEPVIQSQPLHVDAAGGEVTVTLKVE